MNQSFIDMYPLQDDLKFLQKLGCQVDGHFMDLSDHIQDDYSSHSFFIGVQIRHKCFN